MPRRKLTRALAARHHDVDRLAGSGGMRSWKPTTENSWLPASHPRRPCSLDRRTSLRRRSGRR